ncbi:MAG: Hsp70 family protein, partial [Chloroflexota bacterium]
SILEIGEGTFQVKSTSGNTHLGGDDFDHRIVDWLVAEFRKDQGIDLRQDRTALQRLREAAEKAKVELSTTVQTEINLPFITADASGPKHMVYTLTRAKLEQLVLDLVEKSIEPCRQALADAGIAAAKLDEVILVGGQTRMPLVKQKVKEFFGKEPHKGVNPDEAVALGAAIQAGVLKGEVKEVLLLDVTPLTLSIETLGGVATPLIPRNTTIPTSKSQVFTTATDGQPSVEVHVLQGERPMSTDNKSLGRFILDGILPTPRGMPQIEVAFDIDANGILSVRATDKGTGREQKMIIQSSSGLSKDEVERMRREAEQHATEDARKREEAESRNMADTLVYTAEKTLRDHGDRVPQPLRQEVEGKIAALRSALQGGDSPRIRSAAQELSAAMQQVGQAVYQAEGTPPPGGAGPQPGPGSQAPPEGGTIEGEFREV